MGFVDVCALPGFRAPPKKGPRGVYASLQFPCNPRMEVSALLLRLARTGGNHATTVLALHCQLDSVGTAFACLYSSGLLAMQSGNPIFAAVRLLRYYSHADNDIALL
jgi:hypothetical protein